MNEFIEALNNGTGCDYIANNYYKMSKAELKRIILELLFELTRDCGFLDCPNIENVINELKSYIE